MGEIDAMTVRAAEGKARGSFPTDKVSAVIIFSGAGSRLVPLGMGSLVVYVRNLFEFRGR